MSHEQSITIRGRGGKWVNIKGVVDGEFNEKAATDLYRQGKRKPLSGKTFDSVNDAISAAKKRSHSFRRNELERETKGK